MDTRIRIFLGDFPVGLFRLGTLYATKGACEQISSADMRRAVERHLEGDWGELGYADALVNDGAFDTIARVWSAYYDTNGVKFWVITEPDRSSTTILLPGGY